jgi:pimeloyl-ACP methyl ester carboxylesterase
MCVTLFSEQHPEIILGLAPFAPVVSGKLSAESHRTSEPEKFAQWEQTGWREDINPAHPEHIKRLPWSHMLDRLTYDTLPRASQLTMPVLLVVGEIDTSTPAYQVKLLFDVLPEKKEFHIVAGAPHNFREPQHLKELQSIFQRWIEKLMS